MKLGENKKLKCPVKKGIAEFLNFNSIRWWLTKQNIAFLLCPSYGVSNQTKKPLQSCFPLLKTVACSDMEGMF